MSKGLMTGNRTSTNAERGADFYATPYPALAVLLDAESHTLGQLKQTWEFWEPACGNGALVIPLRNRGFKVIATDLHDWGCPDSESGVDFLTTHSFGPVITNPPFGIIKPFVENACSKAPYVAILGRLAFLESTSRHGWFQRMGLRRIHLISDRLPMMHRHGYDGPKMSNAGMAFAWFIFMPQLGDSSPPALHWHLWRESIKKFPMTEADIPQTEVNDGLFRSTVEHLPSAFGQQSQDASEEGLGESHQKGYA